MQVPGRYQIRLPIRKIAAALYLATSLAVSLQRRHGKPNLGTAPRATPILYRNCVSRAMSGETCRWSRVESWMEKSRKAAER
jgi:hypothetical protein